METAAQTNTRQPANLDALALEAAQKIIDIDVQALVGGECQHKAIIQTVVRDALSAHTPGEIAFYWYGRAGEHNARAQSLRDRVDRAERALRAAGFVDLGGEEWQPPVDTEASKLHMKVFHLEGALEGAYEERNRVVAALAKCFPAGITRTEIPGWDPQWHGCVRIDLPTGQASWHYHDDHAHLFAGLPPYTAPYDGHTTAAKYTRLAALKRTESNEPTAAWASNTVWPKRTIRLELTNDTIGDERAAPGISDLLKLIALRLDEGDLGAAQSRVCSGNGWRADIVALPMLDPTIVQDNDNKEVKQ